MNKILLVLAALIVGCTKQPQESSVAYLVTGYNGSTSEWVVEQVDRTAKKRVRFNLVCDFYHAGKNPPASGPSACDLTAGESIDPNPLGVRPGEFIDVWPRGDKLSIVRGSGDDRVIEQFSVKSAQAVAYAGGT